MVKFMFSQHGHLRAISRLPFSGANIIPSILISVLGLSRRLLQFRGASDIQDPEGKRSAEDGIWLGWIDAISDVLAARIILGGVQCCRKPVVTKPERVRVELPDQTVRRSRNLASVKISSPAPRHCPISLSFFKFSVVL